MGTNIRAVLFDLDGVLVDMCEIHFRALNEALLPFGTQITQKEHEETFNGLPSKHKLLLLEEQGRIPAGAAAAINSAKQKLTKKIIPEICIPSAEKLHLMTWLKQSGLKLGCCTNSTHDMAIYMLDSAGLLQYFDIVLGNDSVTNPKPDPEMYIQAMSFLAVSPKETVIIEDSYYGLLAANASGATVLEVRGVEEVSIELFNKLI